MTTQATIKRLEKRYDRFSHKKNNRIMVMRNITEDGRLMDEKDHLLSEDEVKRIKKEDKEVKDKGGLVVYMTSYSRKETKSPPPAMSCATNFGSN